MYKMVINGELYHHGILGQKWGVRRFQNADGTLTSRGRKHISKEYKKYATKASDEFNKKTTDMYVDAYNKAADDMNNGLINKFNRDQEKKYGKDFANRDQYESDYYKLFNNILNKYYDQSIYDFLSNNENFKKSNELIKKYEMQKWDDLAKSNYETIKKMQIKFGGGN